MITSRAMSTSRFIPSARLLRGDWSAGLRPGALEEADCFAPDRRPALRKSMIKIKITRTTTRTIIS